MLTFQEHVHIHVTQNNTYREWILVLVVVLSTRGKVRAWPMKLVRLAYLDTNAVFEREVIRVEIQAIVSPVLEEVATLSRFSPF